MNLIHLLLSAVAAFSVSSELKENTVVIRWNPPMQIPCGTTFDIHRHVIQAETNRHNKYLVASCLPSTTNSFEWCIPSKNGDNNLDTFFVLVVRYPPGFKGINSSNDDSFNGIEEYCCEIFRLPDNRMESYTQDFPYGYDESALTQTFIVPDLSLDEPVVTEETETTNKALMISTGAFVWILVVTILL
eukprot:GHVP01047404.1.p1 GENE.GHVP01047404.1~~GHVP01047404.1.p1  ORF type:complete len:188 (-),score=25.08 GHVP01047404.1:114-677(-)